MVGLILMNSSAKKINFIKPGISPVRENNLSIKRKQSYQFFGINFACIFVVIGIHVRPDHQINNLSRSFLSISKKNLQSRNKSCL